MYSLSPCNFTRSTRHVQIKLLLLNNNQRWKRSCEAATCDAMVHPLFWSASQKVWRNFTSHIRSSVPLNLLFTGAMLLGDVFAVVAPTPLRDSINFSNSVLLVSSFNLFEECWVPLFAGKPCCMWQSDWLWLSQWTWAGVIHVNLASLWQLIPNDFKSNFRGFLRLTFMFPSDISSVFLSSTRKSCFPLYGRNCDKEHFFWLQLQARLSLYFSLCFPQDFFRLCQYILTTFCHSRPFLLLQMHRQKVLQSNQPELRLHTPWRDDILGFVVEAVFFLSLWNSKKKPPTTPYMLLTTILSQEWQLLLLIIIIKISIEDFRFN